MAPPKVTKGGKLPANLETAFGLNKGHKVTKYVPKKPKPSRLSSVCINKL
jgi:hypothetical protein